VGCFDWTLAVGPLVGDSGDGTAPDTVSWCYGDGACGPANWATIAPEFCAGNAQSPIDFPDISGSEILQGSTGAITLTDYETSSETWTIKNTGHSISLSLEDSGTSFVYPTITGRRLGDTYEFLNMHFHWGDAAGVGSEHLEDSISHSGEIHLVHWNTKYTDLTEALTKSDGLAVLGFFMESDSTTPDNADLSPITNLLTSLTNADAQVTGISGINLADITVDASETARYYYYKGGLTTPTCNEIVRWTVFSDVRVPISSTQLQAFRDILDDQSTPLPLVENFRPAQPINGRDVLVRNPSPFDGLFDLVANLPLGSLILSIIQTLLSWIPIIGDLFRVSGGNV